MAKNQRKIKIVNIVGARPNFIKIAPIINELNKVKKFSHILIHTGQHFDYEMSSLFFKQLKIKQPEIYLGIGSGSQAVQTAKIMIALEKVLIELKPDLVNVVGDVNSTLGAAIVSSKLGIPLAHIEAGLRSRDMRMPEEINRLVTDRLADFLFTTSADADVNLIAEGVPKKKIFLTGNVMIDTLLALKPVADKLSAYKVYGLKKKNYVLVTLHRPSNVESKTNLKLILSSLEKISRTIPIIFPVHPRTFKKIKLFGLTAFLSKPNFIITKPLGYLENLSLLSNSKFVITDSGGIQEETTALKIPCLTLRENTERPVTVTEGSNTVIGLDMKFLFRCVDKIMNNKYKKSSIPKYWDGKAAYRIVRKLSQILN
jgi:UDP-N-acetylglucosamine 2-epimerase (non-hydrolysing)